MPTFYRLFIFMFFLSMGSYSTLSSQCIDGTHSPFAGQGWLSCQLSQNPVPGLGESHWISLDLGQVLALDSLRIWNHNEWGKTDMGVREVSVDVRTAGDLWINAGVYTIAEAPGSWKYVAESAQDLNGIAAEQVILTVLSTYGDGECAGIGEVVLSYRELSVFTEGVAADSESFRVFPNPVQDQLYLTLKSKISYNRGGMVAIYNSSGIRVKAEQILGPDFPAIMVGDLPSGMYVLHVLTNENSQTWRTKFIKK